MAKKLIRSNGLKKLVLQFSILFLPLMILPIRETYAADGIWIQQGPEGGIIQTLAIDPASPQILYAGTYDGGAYKSTNAGDTWKAINNGLSSTDINALLVDPLTTRTLYAGTLNGAFKSTNAGSSWTAINTGLGSATVYSLSMDPENHSTLYAGTSQGVYVSTDAGSRWRSSTVGLYGHVISIMIDPVQPQTLYALGSSSLIILLEPSYTLYKSTNGGSNWNQVDFDLPLRAIAIDPAEPQTLYAATEESASLSSGERKAIYKSTDGGNSWAPAVAGLTAFQVNALAVDPTNHQTLYAGTICFTPEEASNGIIFKSTDSGSTWNFVSTDISYTSVYALAINPAAPQTLYAGTSNGVFRSQSGGQSWNLINTGLFAHQVSSLAIDPVTQQMLYAGTNRGGVYKTTDGGLSWNSANMGLIARGIKTLAIDPNTPQTLFAGSEVTRYGHSGSSMPLFRSTNGGSSWDALNFTEDANALAIDPKTPRTIYAATSDNIPFIIYCQGATKSTDGGNTWFVYSINPAPCANALVIDPVNPQTLYMGADSYNGNSVFKSTDAGRSWNGLSIDDGSSVYTLAIDPATPQTVYATTYEKVFRSTNGGSSWALINTGLPSLPINALAIAPSAPRTLYVGTNEGVFKSTDAGNHWSPFSAGLNFSYVLSFAIDPTDSNKVYVGTRGGSVYVLSSSPSSLGLNISSGGAASFATAGEDPDLTVGYSSLTVNSGNLPYGTAVFSFKQDGITVTEAGVPASPPTTHARIFIDYRIDVNAIPARDDAGRIDANTGIAVVNYSDEIANVTYTLRDLSGSLITSGTGTIAPRNHFSRFIDQFGEIATGFELPDNFLAETRFASLEISSDQLLSILALRMTANQRDKILYTTTPVADLTQPLSTDPVYFAQFADGGGYAASLILLNTSDALETGTLQLLDNDGAPLSITPVGGTSSSSFNYSIPVGGFYLLRTDGSPVDAKVGWVRLTPDEGTSTPVGSGVFGYNPGNVLQSESGVPAALATTHARVYVDLSGNHNTGLAIANLESTPAEITINAFEKDGVTAAGTNTGPLELAANAHKAKFADELISGLPAGFTGVLDVSSTTPFAALTIRSLNNEDNKFLMTTFPVADVTRPAPSPIVFPQIADGGGYRSEFILISPTGEASSTLSFFDESGAPMELGD